MPHPRIRYLIPIFLGALLLAGFFLVLNTTQDQRTMRLAGIIVQELP